VQNGGHDSGACSNAVSNIMSYKPDALIVGGIGGSPAEGFAKAGLDVYVDSESATVKESIDMFIAKKLQTIGSSGTCSAH
jgi:predicted Fe-Mo cluster-binding NifX family protein